MDVIAGKVKNEHNPALSAEGLPDAWAESITNIMLLGNAGAWWIIDHPKHRCCMVKQQAMGIEPAKIVGLSLQKST